nr:YetF domain-containing protein [Paenibacillus sp. UNC496MF]
MTWHSARSGVERGRRRFIAFLVAAEYLTLHSNRAERLLKGMAVPVIQEGKPIVEILRKLGMSMDDLEKRLRMAGISQMEDIRTGTLETNGELGYELYPRAKPLCMELSAANGND